MSSSSSSSERVYATASASSGVFYLPMDAANPPIPTFDLEAVPVPATASQKEDVDMKEEEEETTTPTHHDFSQCQRVIHTGNIQMNGIYFGSPMYS